MGAVGFQEADYIWKDGKYVGWHDANIHLLSTAVQFGTSVFEGIRAYETAKGPAIFRLDAHIDRLMDSAKVYRMLGEGNPIAVVDEGGRFAGSVTPVAVLSELGRVESISENLELHRSETEVM